MAKEQLTKNQHYIPQVYLRGFSQDSLTIYEYNYKKGEAIKEPVSIESVCREKYLYEVLDNNGEIINANYIEDILCGYEGLFAKYRKQLLSKSHIIENYQTHCFLTKEEKDFWTFYAALNIMRNPEILIGIKTILKDELQDHVSDIDAKNLAIAYCLPFFDKPKEGEINALTGFISILLTKVLYVGFCESDNLFTSDHSMYGSGSYVGNVFKFGMLWFPISSNCAIIFSDPQSIGSNRKNRLIPITDEEVQKMNKGIAYIAKRMVLSKHPFTESDICLIKEARKEKAQDEFRKVYH